MECRYACSEALQRGTLRLVATFGSESGSTMIATRWVGWAASWAAMGSMNSVRYRASPPLSTASSPAEDLAEQSRLGRS